MSKLTLDGPAFPPLNGHHHHHHLLTNDELAKFAVVNNNNNKKQYVAVRKATATNSIYGIDLLMPHCSLTSDAR